MFGALSVAVVVPAFNEADKIARAIALVPPYIDHVIVVDDGSTDGTPEVAARAARAGLEIVRHGRNAGVGRAIATGYQRALDLGAQAIAVMAGDAQMDPADLPALLAPIERGHADYVKGNRFAWPNAMRLMPPVRLLGNFVLSHLTRLAVGRSFRFDSQCGYTAITRQALLALEPARLFPRYGYPNDILARLSEAGARIADVPVRPVYGPGWRSGLRPFRVLYPISRLLLAALSRRLGKRLRRAHRRADHVLSAPAE